MGEGRGKGKGEGKARPMWPPTTLTFGPRISCKERAGSIDMQEHKHSSLKKKRKRKKKGLWWIYQDDWTLLLQRVLLLIAGLGEGCVGRTDCSVSGPGIHFQGISLSLLSSSLKGSPLALQLDDRRKCLHRALLSCNDSHHMSWAPRQGIFTQNENTD